MSKARLGPFELGECLGEGGMGRVYRASHVRSGVEVAIKVISGAVNNRSKKAFEREVQAHAGLVHPGVVYLFDYGTIDEDTARRHGDDLVAKSPYVVMELAERGTLRQALPFRHWGPVRDLLLQTLDALAFAHARSVIHRDLKPENILLFEGENRGLGRVKLADFGIAHAFGEEHQRGTESLTSISGTPLYMAPEQVRGRWRSYGPWTDIYALGCVAYELVCHRPPFEGSTAMALALAHCQGERPRLEPQFPVPQRLQQWIDRALTIDVRARFRRCADAAFALPERSEAEAPTQVAEAAGLAIGHRGASMTQILTHLDQSAPTLVWEPADAPSDAGPGGEPHKGEEEQAGIGRIPDLERPPFPEDWRVGDADQIPTPLIDAGLGLFGLREIPFVDRFLERDLIWETLREVIHDEVYRIVLIVGESGTGKSELARWALTRAHEVGAAVKLKATHSPGGQFETEGIRGFVHRAFRTWGLSRGQFYEYLSTLLPEHDAQALTEYIYPTTEDDDRIEGPRYRFASHSQKMALLGRLFAYILADRPAVVWADDIQWGDDTLGLMEYLAERPRRAPTSLVIATVRSEALAADQTLARRVDALRNTDACRTVELGPLAPEDHRAFIDQLLPLEAELADGLAARSQGNPLFCHQLLGEWIAADALTIGDEGFELAEDVQISVPDDVHQLWMLRLDRLDDRLGRPGADQARQAIEVAAALGHHFEEEQWRQVCRRAGLEVSDESMDILVEWGLIIPLGGRWTFAHARLVDSMRRAAREAGRWEEHNRHCAAMLETLTPDGGGRHSARVAEHWIAAGKLEQSLQALATATDRAALHGDIARATHVIRRRLEVLDMLGVCANHHGRLHAEIDLVRMELRRGDKASVRRRIDSLLARCDDDVDPAIRCRLCEQRAHLMQIEGELDRGERYYREALEYASQSDDNGLQTVIHSQLAWHLFLRGELDDAQRHLDEAAELLGDELVNYDRLRLFVLGGWIKLTREHFDEARQLFERAIDWGRDRGYRDMVGAALNGLGDCARLQGDIEEAKRCYLEMAKVSRELDAPPKVMSSSLNVAVAQLELDEFSQARQTLDEVRALVRELDQHAGSDLFLLCELGCAAGAGNWDEVDRLIREYSEIWTPSRIVVTDFPRLLERAAQCCSEAGKMQRARRLWALAASQWERLQQADKARGVRAKATRETGQ